MTLNELQNSIRELGGQIRAAAAALSAAAADPNASTSNLTTQRDALNAMNERMAALQAAYNAQYEAETNGLPTGAQVTPPQQERTLRDILKSNEYARAFASAVRCGARPGRPMIDETHKVLYDALTIAGGSPAGEDGGFLVPEDIDNTIRELRRDFSPLSDLFNVEAVSSNTGWRVVDAAPATGMTALPSEVPSAGIAQDDLRPDRACEQRTGKRRSGQPVWLPCALVRQEADFDRKRAAEDQAGNVDRGAGGGHRQRRGRAEERTQQRA